MKKLVISALVLSAALSASANDATPLWLRNVAISPDGTTVAFTYKGDIYTVPATGGQARQLTTSPYYDTKPVWSPDGKQIAFASERNYSLDIYVMPATGGTATRLTTNGGRETPLAWLDGETLLFSSNLMPSSQAIQGGFQNQIYKVKTDGKTRPQMFMSFPLASLSVNGQGQMLAHYQPSVENAFRKHERSSGTADIWLVDNGNFTKLTDFNGHSLNPVWAADGKSYYYTTEAGSGTLNVHRRTLDGTDTQLTSFDRHPVRSLSAAADGTLAFSWNGEIYTFAPGAAEPQKLNVDIITDDYTKVVEKKDRTWGASDMAVSPDGEEVAFVLAGNVFVTSTKYGTTRQITNTPEQERRVDFSSDGRTLVYDSERDGIWQLFTATIKNPEEKKFTYATEVVETPLYKSDKPAFQPQFSPDGKEVAFLEDRTELRVINLESKKVRTALDGKYNYSYTDGDVSFEWSPDSRWFLVDYIGIGGWNNTDIALVKADGSEVHDLTESGYSDGNAKWVLDGKAMIWSSDRQGYRSHGSWGSQRDAFIMFFDGEAYDRFMMSEEELSLLTEEEKSKSDESKDSEKKDSKDKNKKKKDDKKKDDSAVKPLEFDLENAKYRVRRLTDNSTSLGDFALDKKGDKFYYLASFDGSADLYQKDLRKGDRKVLRKGAGFGALVPDSKCENLFMIGNGMKKISMGSGETTDISYRAWYDYSPYAEREYMFDHMWRQVKDKFYDENLHGVDWEYYREAYRRFLPHITNSFDFGELYSEILGELNASHTGGGGGARGAKYGTASLGAFFDDNYAGEGLLVTEVLKRGPLSTKAANVRPGDVILAIDGTAITPGMDYFPLLEGRQNHKTRISVRRADSGKTEDVYVKPVAQGTIRDLLYDRWVERNQAIVDSVSGGRIAYVHIQGMNSPSYRRVFSELLGKYRNHEAVVVDTRWNGGGWLHNDIAVLLSGKEYVRFAPRGKYIGSEPFTQWTKPSAMLINESNYSDAHGTPYTYKTLGIGELIGAPVPGTMTAVWWETQINGEVYFGIPQVTSLDRNGKPLENQQLNPDVLIYNNPAEVMQGIDRQLIGATRHLLEKLDSAASAK